MARTLWGLGLILPRPVSAWQLCLAFLYGNILGFTPTVATLHSVVLLFSFVVLRVPLLWTLLTAVLSYVLAMLALDPLLDKIGSTLLTETSLQGLWTQIYNAPLLPLLRLHNSIVLGALVVSLLLLPLWLMVSFKMAAIQNGTQGKGA